FPSSFSRDGKRLAFWQRTAAAGSDIWTLSLDLTDPDHPTAGQPEVFLQTPFSEQCPAFSPDGRWISYTSNESGQDEIFVRPFPIRPGKWMISAGSRPPMWSHDGKDLLFTGPDNRMRSVAYTTDGHSFTYSKPLLWSTTQIAGEIGLAPDGKQVLIAAATPQS